MVGTEELYIPVDPAGMDPWDPERGEMVARGTCLRASLVCIAVCDVADDSPISDETGLAAEGVCSIGILICVLCVNNEHLYRCGGNLGRV